MLECSEIDKEEFRKKLADLTIKHKTLTEENRENQLIVYSF